MMRIMHLLITKELKNKKRNEEGFYKFTSEWTRKHAR